ncbi:cyclopropane-fatty-acyl-phospholipid synthase family protein [Terrarubrum flagellatum]|uniref:cyclopropane-fatty-acyl-phospholipid synthase family protein n=1 Tax=Terrirubrum flagellatum TaxID=2895980 RepID=UPI00314564F4
MTSGDTTSPAGVVPRDMPFTARLAFSYAKGIQRGRLDVELPDGRKLAFHGREPGPHALMLVRDWGFARRMVAGGDIGLGEAYMRNEWDSPDVTKFLELFCVNHSAIETMLDGRSIIRWWQQFRHYLNRNTHSGSKRNIHAHYDLGNHFYSAWLDRTMTYSSAIFAPGDNDLASGQTRKYRALAEGVDLKRDHHVLEIGCGWGGFAEYAAKEIGCKVTGLTISQEQFDFARRRMQKEGLSDKVEIKLQDYRDETGVYDRIASIEMFEAVGENYWPSFFSQMRDRLKSGGFAGVQVITIQEKLFESYRREIDFIRRYIFPGGMLPTPTIMRQLGEKFGVPLKDEREFALDYAQTLSAWRERFFAAWPQLLPLGFDERFKRMWNYYFSYCEAGFRSKNIDVRQMVFGKPN